MRGATGVTIQPHQILRLSRRKARILSPQSHMKPHLQCAEQQVSRSNLTKYCACHAEGLAYLVFITFETSFTMRRATAVTIQLHQILGRLSRKMTRQNFKENVQKQVKRHFQCGDDPRNDPTMIRPWSDHDPRMKPSVRNPPRNRGYFSSSPRAFSNWKITTFRAQSYIQTFTKCCASYTKSNTWTSPNTAPTTKSKHFNFTKYCTCHEKWHLTFTKYCACHEKWHRGSSSSHIKPHLQCAGANRCHHQTSPNTAPVTHKDSHSESSSHMKPHFQCAEQQVSRSNLTKYCACHAERLAYLVLIT